jgi:hypothetical protein
MAGRLLRAWAFVWMALLLLPLRAGTQTPPDPPADPRVPLGDLLEIVFERNQVIAFGASGGSLAERLEFGEQVHWHGTQGAVAVVLTDRRVLAVATVSASWQETRYGRAEQPPGSALLGDRVALVATSERAFGFDGGSGNLIEYRLGPQESLVATRTGANVALVVTDRKLLGLSPFVGGFFTTELGVREHLEKISPGPNLVTVTTNRRYLVFRADSTIWTERKRALKS